MFEDSLVESAERLACCRNPWSTVISFAAQILVGGILVLLSLIYTEALPSQKATTILEQPPRTAAPPRPVLASSVSHNSRSDGSVLISPQEIAKTIAIDRDQAMPGNSGPTSGFGIPNGVPGESSDNALAEVLRTLPVAALKAAPAKVHVSSGVAQGLLIRQVKPEYPALARQARIQGTVVLQAVIGKDGTVQNLRVVSGHPMLAAAAIDAVRQWLYRPYYLNGEPVEVDTQINVNFALVN